MLTCPRCGYRLRAHEDVGTYCPSGCKDERKSVTFFVPGRLQNPTNARWHWTQRRKWAEQWRGIGRVECRLALGRTNGRGPVVAVSFLCQVRRRFDSDNLAACCKPLRDGIADALEITDGPMGTTAWHYEQVVGSPPGVQVTVDYTQGGE